MTARTIQLLTILPLALLAACDASFEAVGTNAQFIIPGDTTSQDDMIVPAAVMVYGIGGPLGPSANGQYDESGSHYNNAPVYTRGTLSLYRRADGKWYVDSNAISEDVNGTVEHTLQAQDWP
jgi:hypothetical protein